MIDYASPDSSLIRPQGWESPRRYSSFWAWSAIACLLLALPAFFFLDASLVHFIHDHQIDAFIKKIDWIRRKTFFIWPGHYACTILIAILAANFSRKGAAALGLILLSGAITILNAPIKWIIGRPRPNWETGEPGFALHPFRGGLPGLFFQKNLAFPSGDAALAIATACSLSAIAPRYRLLWWSLCLIVPLQRLAENAHHLSDVLVAAALGITAFHLARIACNLSPDTMEPSNATDSASTAAAPATPSGDRLVITLPTESPAPFLSLVIPCYNEHENVPELLTRLETSLAKLGKSFEVIIVDDGSTDTTPQLLADGMKRLLWLRVIRMAKNGGQSAAFEAGFEAARGELIATIDADLQNDPEEIPRLIPMLDEHKVDMITGWRKDRKDTPFRRWQSRQANRIRNWISQDTVIDSASSLKVYRAYTLKGLKLFNGAHRFFPTLVKMRGYTVLETPVKHSARFAGTAKYGFRNRALRAFIDLLAIRWMKSRWLRYKANEVRPTEEKA